MRVFVTGASGLIGLAVTKELLKAGHTVLGLARSDDAAETLRNLGVDVQRGSLTDLESLKEGAAASDGVIHCAFLHDFTNYSESCRKDREAIRAMADGLAGSNRPLVVTSGTMIMSYDHGDDDDHGFMNHLINTARTKGVSVYVDDGLNRWSAVHYLDSAVAYRLALEKGSAGSVFHGVAQEGIKMRDIAEVIGKKLGVPVELMSTEVAKYHYGWFASAVAADNPCSNKRTREVLGWNPQQRTLLADLEDGKYFDNRANVKQW